MKFDGYRSQIVRDADGVRIYTRRGVDWTAKYRDLAKAGDELRVESAIIDGEVMFADMPGSYRQPWLGRWVRACVDPSLGNRHYPLRAILSSTVADHHSRTDN